MPPKKKGGNQPSKKSVEKAKDKIVQDKTFGLKNKNKSAKVQKYVQAVSTQVKGNKVNFISSCTFTLSFTSCSP
jgi:hypothetical protein